MTAPPLMLNGVDLLPAPSASEGAAVTTPRSRSGLVSNPCTVVSEQIRDRFPLAEDVRAALGITQGDVRVNAERLVERRRHVRRGQRSFSRIGTLGVRRATHKSATNSASC